jgi:Deoxyribonuclease II
LHENTIYPIKKVAFITNQFQKYNKMIASAPTPLISATQPVDWFFAFKFNSESFPGCDDNGTCPEQGSIGIFGGTFQTYPKGHSQRYVYASSLNPTLAKGEGALGATLNDPLGATFAQVYLKNDYNYCLWNDQFYGDPSQFPKFLDKPWGHSKGMLAWNDEGEGFVLQVSTPSWPAAGNQQHPRTTDGNTLGTVKDDDVEVSQHFFCLRITKDDLVVILQALANASVVTDPTVPQIVKNGGPADVQNLVNQLGKVSENPTIIKSTLSSGIQIISKPHTVAAPVWQLVSAQLDSVPLRVATWWENPEIYSTDENSVINCWQASYGKPGPVEIALNGNWDGVNLGLKGGPYPEGNHAKVGVSKDATRPYSIFGDMNQQGTLSPVLDPKDQGANEPTCAISQNARGGLFYVINNPQLCQSISQLIEGDAAPIQN